MHGICPALFGKRVRNRCACRPRLQPDSVEFDEEMRRPERIGDLARQGKGRGEFPGKERAQGIPGLPGAFEDQLAGSGGDRAGGADRADRASVAQDVANSSPLGGRQLRVCRQSARSDGFVVAERQAHPAVGSGVQGGERSGKSRCSRATASCGERAKVRRNLDPGMRSWPSIASSVNPARRRLSRRASSAVSKWVRM